MIVRRLLVGSSIRLITRLDRSNLFHLNGIQSVATRYASSDRSKVEFTLKMLREDVLKQDEEAKKLKLISTENSVATVKPPLKERILHELKHYYNGFRLLALETKLSAKYIWRIIKGSPLARRERQQLVRTVSDLFRLVPFSIFIIVPFMELALPIFIKLFPNMLPSTFQESSKEEEKIRKQLKVRVEMAKFLQDTIEEIALERKSLSKDQKDTKSLEFAKFIKKARKEGGYVSNSDLLKFTKLFEDELTLDNLNMGQLRSLCRLMGVQTLGSPEILRFQLNMKIRELKADDRAIAAEGGIDNLSSLDLQQACRARGMRALGLSEERLREQLSQWLELSLNDKVPPSLLLLSRTLYLPEDVSFTDRLKAIVGNLPESIAHTTQQKLTEMEGGKVDHSARIHLLKSIEDAISAEKAAEKKRLVEAAKQKELLAEEAKVKAVEQQKESDQKVEVPIVNELAAGLREATLAADKAVRDVKEELVAAVVAAKKTVEEPIKVDKSDLSSIEEIIVGGPLHEAKHDIIGLKEKVIEHTEDLVEINSLDGEFAETKVAKRLRSKLNSMIEHVDELVDKLQEEKRNVKETIADPAEDNSATLKQQREVRIQDVIDTLARVKDTDKQTDEDRSRHERIVQLLKVIDEDADGIVDKDIVLEVVDLLEKVHGDVAVSASQIASLVGTLKKEEELKELNTEFKKVQAGDFDMPVLPTGPSSAGAFVQNNENSDRTPEVIEAKKIELPNVDPKVTSTQVQQQQKVKAQQNGDTPPPM